METVFGVKWTVATKLEIFLVLIILGIVVMIFIFLKIRQYKKDRIIHNRQLFLFKMKRIGLSNFQIRILTNMAEILHINNHSDLLVDKKLFEKAVGKFLHYLRSRDESEKSLKEICKDIVIIHEKCYNEVQFKKPLESPQNLEANQLIYFISDHNVYLARINATKENSIIVELFRKPQELKNLQTDSELRVFLWRIGDAQYSFTSKIIERRGQFASITIPDEIKKDKELRHPFINTIIPVSVKIAHPDPLEENTQLQGTLHKFNNYEAVFKINKELDYGRDIVLTFELYDVELAIECRIIANQTIQDEKAAYYTVKFLTLTEIQAKIIKQYMAEHI